MKIFFVAIYSHFEGTNVLFKIEATDEFEAVKKALFLHAEMSESRNSDYDEWINNFVDMEHLKQESSNCDLSISNVIEYI